MEKITYRAGPTLSRFHRSKALVRGVMGPRGSGKSTGMSCELFRRSCEQIPFNGVRKTRHAIIRNTYRELEDTTIKTWLQWFPEEKFGKLNRGDMSQHIENDDMEAEILFRALDRPGDIKKVLSLELTGAWINEAREVPRGIINGLIDAIGRYPPIVEGGPSWHGLVMDSNPPDEDHWWYKLAEEERPVGWEFWRQPGGLIEKDGKFIPNLQAENLDNLLGHEQWYVTRAAGAPLDHIRVYYCSQYGFVLEGKSVYQEYHDALHAATEILNPVPGLPIFIGLDFGLTPAGLFAQRLVNGRWHWFDELVTEDMGIQRFSELMKPKLNEYHGFEFKIFGDPAGNIRSQTDEKTCYQILEANGIKATPTHSNDFTMRREAVAASLRRLIDGKPGLIISPKCKIARKAMSGGYHFKRVQVAGEERFHDEPNKDRFSHIAEAGQYAMLGGGEGDLLTKMGKELKIKTPNIRINQRDGWML